jgi:hypothetical protein
MNIKLIGIVFFNIILIGAFGWFYYYVVIAQEAQAAMVYRELVILEENRRLLKERETSHALWQQFEQPMHNFFFRAEHLVAWLEFLEEAARHKNLSFEVTSFDETEHLLQVNLKGGLADTLAFFRAAQVGPYGIAVHKGVIRTGQQHDIITQVTFLFYVEQS